MIDLGSIFSDKAKVKEALSRYGGKYAGALGTSTRRPSP